MVWNRTSLAAAVVLSLIPAAGSAREGLHDPDFRIPAAWRSEGQSAFEQLVAARGALLDRRSFERLRLDLLRSENRAAAVADPEFVFPFRAGDLDGDGKQDVLTFEFERDEALLQARSGLTGTALWSLPGAYAAVPADLDGDGAGELLAVSSRQTSPAPGISVNTQLVSAVGADGREAWSYVVPGPVVRQGDHKRGAASDAEFIVGLRAIPDATGDGKTDVWVGTLTFAQLNTGEMLVEADVFSGRTIDGATGMEVGRVVAAAANGLPWVVPAADVSGDGLADAFALTAGSLDRGILSARSAAGVVHWTRDVPTVFAYPFVHEMTADGRPDVMLQAFTPEGGQRLGFSGADGTPLWSRTDTGYIDAAGDVDGDGATDMIQLETMDTSIVATAWSGKTGANLWGPVSSTGPQDAWVLFCICTDDLTGDGVWDPLTAEVLFGDAVEVTVRTLDGADGSPLWVADLPGSDGFPIPIGADADGDGAGDVGLASSDGSQVVVRTLRGTDFSPIWSTTAAMDGFPLGFYGDDVAGDGAPEIVLASIRFVEESIRGAAHAFAPGGRLWTVP